MPECLKEMRQQAEQLDEIYYVYVIDDENRLQGVFPLKKMITSPSVSKVKHVMRKDPISVRVDTSVDDVVQTIEKYDLVAVPVIGLAHYIIICFHILGKTGCQLVITFRLLTNFIHDVVYVSTEKDDYLPFCIQG